MLLYNTWLDLHEDKSRRWKGIEKRTKMGFEIKQREENTCPIQARVDREWAHRHNVWRKTICFLSPAIHFRQKDKHRKKKIKKMEKEEENREEGRMLSVRVDDVFLRVVVDEECVSHMEWSVWWTTEVGKRDRDTLDAVLLCVILFVFVCSKITNEWSDTLCRVFLEEKILWLIFERISCFTCECAQETCRRVPQISAGRFGE